VRIEICQSGIISQVSLRDGSKSFKVEIVTEALVGESPIFEVSMKPKIGYWHLRLLTNLSIKYQLSSHFHHFEPPHYSNLVIL